MAPTEPALTLGTLRLNAVDAAALEQLRTSFKTRTLPKLREDTRRNARNVALARTRVAYG